MNDKEKMPPLVSVLMCTFNNAVYLREAIDSILQQTYPNIEFIIVNDGSTDQTKDIILSYESPKIRYYENKKNRGQEYTKNKGIVQAKGKYIAYMDGDDISERQRIATQVEFLETHSDVGFCSTGVTFFGTRSGQLFTAETDEAIRLDALLSTPMAHATCMIRREILALHQINYVQGFLATEDYWFILCLLEKTKVYSIQQPLYRYRWHDKNISVTKGGLQQEHFKRISQKAFKQLLKIELSEQEHALVYSIFRGKISIEKIKQIHPRLIEALKTSKSDLISPFKPFYVKHLIKAYGHDLQDLISTLNTF